MSPQQEARNEVIRVVSLWQATQTARPGPDWERAYYAYNAYLDDLAQRLIAADNAAIPAPDPSTDYVGACVSLARASGELPADGSGPATVSEAEDVEDAILRLEAAATVFGNTAFQHARQWVDDDAFHRAEQAVMRARNELESLFLAARTTARAPEPLGFVEDRTIEQRIADGDWPTDAEVEAAAIGRYVEEFDAPQDWTVEQEEHKEYWREEGRKALIAARNEGQS